MNVIFNDNICFRDKMKKVTQIDFQIMELESRSFTLSAIERLKLSNLKEQKTLMANQGIKMKASLVPRFLPPSRKSSGSHVRAASKFDVDTFTGGTDDTARKVTESSNDKLESAADEEDEELPVEVGENDVEKPKSRVSGKGKRKQPSGQGLSCSYILFLQHERENLLRAEPHAKLDLPAVRLKWSEMKVDEKKVFEDMAQAKKAALGDDYRKNIRNNKLSDVDKRLRKIEANKKYKEKIRKEKSVDEEEQESLKVKMEEMKTSKIEKLDRLKIYVENLKSEVLKTQQIKKENIEQTVAKDLELILLKEQFKLLHKMHKKCAKDENGAE